MNEKDGSKEWFRLPQRCLHDEDLTLADVIVLAVIVDYIDGESKPMSLDRIMQKTSLSKSQVKISIKNLVANKYITAESRAGKKTIFTQCDVLPPKRPKKQPQQPQKSGSGLDLEKYKIFINSDLEGYGE